MVRIAEVIGFVNPTSVPPVNEANPGDNCWNEGRLVSIKYVAVKFWPVKSWFVPSPNVPATSFPFSTVPVQTTWIDDACAETARDAAIANVAASNLYRFIFIALTNGVFFILSVLLALNL